MQVENSIQISGLNNFHYTVNTMINKIIDDQFKKIEKTFLGNLIQIKLNNNWIYKGYISFNTGEETGVIMKHCYYEKSYFFNKKENFVSCICPCGAILKLEDWQIFALRLSENKNGNNIFYFR